MRILPILFLLASLCQAFPNSNSPLRGKELFRKNHPDFKDLDEVAQLIAEHKKKVADRLEQEHDDSYKEAVAKAREQIKNLNPKPVPGGRVSIERINAALGLDEVLVEGDILMTADEARRYFEIDSVGRSKRQAYQPRSNPNYNWEYSIPYAYEPSLSDDSKHYAKWAMDFWQNNTCLTFHEVDSSTASKQRVLYFINGGGCYSGIGRGSGVGLQEVSACDAYYTSTHEVGHALGFMHEQSRWDRDDYINVDLDNVKKNKKHNYNKRDKDENNNFGKQYDFRGIMHYTDGAFALDDTKTVMFARNPGYQMSIGSDEYPDYGDIYEMNMQYSCYDKCKNSGTICYNEGKPNPNNCSVCQCPSGFGGPRCFQREAPVGGLNCGESLWIPRGAGSAWQTLAVSKQVGDGTGKARARKDPAYCTWHIRSLDSAQIEYEVVEVGTGRRPNDLCVSICQSGGVSIKGLEKTWKPEGMKFCCEEQLNKTMTTAKNLLIVQGYNFQYYTDFVIRYRSKQDEVPTTTTTTTTTTTRPPVTVPQGNVHHYIMYILVTAPLSFNDAAAFCETQNAILAYIPGPGIEKALQKRFRKVDPYFNDVFWIGFYKPQGMSSEYEWLNGEDVTYTNWATGQPRPTPTEQCALHLDTEWVGTNCEDKHSFVCKKLTWP
ncbi:hypothetical protein QR680_011113 [Steinernema hermaphroditum]|uniref:Metalloendopeptidase n=1 Tax=Steinernema hermaphroditum TaxID=289476 RepID=A0AA39ISC1_9BILA|nr:hypothetical protein QR680_011113 [Steinernema hermaphroditum]